MTRSARGRGPHHEDATDLGPEAWPALRAASSDLAWLLGRGYAEKAAIALVGDRFQLTRRQRDAVIRSTCTDEERAGRVERRVEDFAGEHVQIDGFNVLIPVERALGGGPLLRGREGAFRDLGGIHGTWRSVVHTRGALERVGRGLEGAAQVTWWLDRPVSNSGRLAAMVREVSDLHGWGWAVRLEDRVDPGLAVAEGVIATSDAWILEQGVRWVDLIGPVVERDVERPWVVDFDLGVGSAREVP